jgi:transcriptional regulator GlxA family with amidase domain
LAAQVGVSQRMLYLAFNRHLGTSPATYLLGKRLEAARAHLLGERPGLGTIGEGQGFRFRQRQSFLAGVSRPRR